MSQININLKSKINLTSIAFTRWREAWRRYAASLLARTSCGTLCGVNMKEFVALVSIFCLSLTCYPVLASENQIHVNPGKYNNYYHISYTLTPENCELKIPISERTPKYTETNEYTFSEGGQFEVFLRKSYFPVHAPHLKGEFIILRMPWTDPDDPDSNQKIEVKRHLFDSIRKMKIIGKGSVLVVLELNPYIKVVQDDPLKLELSGRNIFFRQSHDSYIDYVGKLKK